MNFVHFVVDIHMFWIAVCISVGCKSKLRLHNFRTPENLWSSWIKFSETEFKSFSYSRSCFLPYAPVVKFEMLHKKKIPFIFKKYAQWLIKCPSFIFFSQCLNETWNFSVVSVANYSLEIQRRHTENQISGLASHILSDYKTADLHY